jgi:thiamine-phosphate pyrophosphorylase
VKPLTLHVYVITESVPKFKRTHKDVASAALAGGADLIQFRDKLMADDEFEIVATKLLQMCRAKHVPLIVNDRLEIAARIRADGIHVGQEDIVPNSTHISNLRKMWTASGFDPIVGVSARNYQEAVALADSGADYLGVGPIFATGSKADASEPIGVSELSRICAAVRIPIVAIGGITSSNLPHIIESGAAGAAVISAVTHQYDMKSATEVLQHWWKSYSATLPKRWIKGSPQ